jgi:hypothetical protein
MLETDRVVGSHGSTERLAYLVLGAVDITRAGLVARIVPFRGLPPNGVRRAELDVCVGQVFADSWAINLTWSARGQRRGHADPDVSTRGHSRIDDGLQSLAPTGVVEENLVQSQRRELASHGRYVDRVGRHGGVGEMRIEGLY